MKLKDLEILVETIIRKQLNEDTRTDLLNYFKNIWSKDDGLIKVIKSNTELKDKYGEYLEPNFNWTKLSNRELQNVWDDWAKVDRKLNEGTYNDFVAQTDDTPRKKVNIAIAEINSNLRSIERLAKHATRLKSEASVSSDNYWTSTKQRIGKIQERMTRLGLTLKNLGAYG